MSDKPHTPIKRALVLSGGGGRGAYQAGVCKVLAEKPWQPDLVLANSIGATNGAIFVAPKRKQYTPAELLDKVWREEMLRDKVQQVAGEWPWYLHLLIGLVIKLLTLQEPPDCRTAHGDLLRLALSDSLEPPKVEDEILFPERRLPTHALVKRLLERLEPQQLRELLARPALMEREGWRKLLRRNVHRGRLNADSAPYFGVAVTDPETGATHMFWNRVPQGVQGIQADPRLETRHLMASSSIPGVYKPTKVDKRFWWDGFVGANTPIAPALKVGAEKIIVVLMTPWVKPSPKPTAPTIQDALERFLDWMMLASFRREYEALTKKQKKRIKIIAPEHFQGILSIIDYDQEDNEKLIECGEQDARRVLKWEG